MSRFGRSNATMTHAEHAASDQPSSPHTASSSRAVVPGTTSPPSIATRVTDDQPSTMRMTSEAWTSSAAEAPLSGSLPAAEPVSLANHLTMLRTSRSLTALPSNLEDQAESRAHDVSQSLAPDQSGFFLPSVPRIGRSSSLGVLRKQVLDVESDDEAF